MATSETGHAKNVANFETLNSFCTGYGASYNPSKTSIKLTALTALYTSAQNSLRTVNTAFAVWSKATDAREIIFDPLNKLTTRIMNALKASGVPKQTVDGAETFARKIQGRRASPKDAAPAPDPAAPAEDTSTNISVSQMSFDNRVSNMGKLVELLTGEPSYTPNETELTTASLTTLLANMTSSNTAVKDAYTPLSNARIDRDKILYKDETGLVDIAGSVKVYVKSAFGALSPQYKQISSLKFVKILND